jgi:hypothetical protein
MRDPPRGATLEAASVFGGAVNEGGAVHTVIARSHLSRDPDLLESDLARAGAEDAQITGYTVALTFGGDSRERATETARRLLDRIGATGIKIQRPKTGPPRESNEVSTAGNRRADEETANLMAKLEMDVFGHP